MSASYKVFPSIGIARVGNSPTDFYYGPEKFRGLPTEVIDGKEQPVTNFRDPQGRMKRQAARFRVWSADSDGTPQAPVEIGKGGVVDIRWTAHLANKKAVWYKFEQLKGENGYKKGHPLRNAQIKKDSPDRKKLIIDPGPLTVSSGAPSAEFTRGKGQNGYPQTFPPEDLGPRQINTLGEIQMDAQGQLTLLGGLGNSGFSTLVADCYKLGGPPRLEKICSYANNEAWFDDISDGPVTAVIVFSDGSEVEVDAPSWVLCTPPGYAPQVPNVVTLYDTMYDVFVRKQNFNTAICVDGNWVDDYVADFALEIAPILAHAEAAQWVVAVPAYAHLPLRNPALGDPSEASASARQQIFGAIRGPDDANVARNSNNKKMMPFQAGDNPFPGDDKTYPGPRYLTVTATQYFLLGQWVKGKFSPGHANQPTVNPCYELDRAILRNCVGGPFNPGIEITWISRNPKIYSEPFRIRNAPVGPNGLSLDDRLDEGVEPGDLTKRMAIPWQADFHECTEQPIPIDHIEPYWWPAQRPFSIYLQDHEQVPWARGISPANSPGDLTMVSKWDALGFIINQGTDQVPDYVEVERDDKSFEPGV